MKRASTPLAWRRLRRNSTAYGSLATNRNWPKRLHICTGSAYHPCSSSDRNEKRIDALSLAPLKAELYSIRQLGDKSELAEEIAHLHRIGVSSLFEFRSE